MSIAHQLSRYIVYTCKKCNWQTAILAQWADLKPKRCMNRKCGCFFLKEPDQLDVKRPDGEQPKKPAPSTLRKKQSTKKKTTRKKNERRSEGRKKETSGSQKD